MQSIVVMQHLLVQPLKMFDFPDVKMRERKLVSVNGGREVNARTLF